MYSAIIKLEGRYDVNSIEPFPPSKVHIKDIFVPWFIKKGWIVDGEAFLESCTLLSLKGETEFDDNLIVEFCEYIKVTYTKIDYHGLKRLGFPTNTLGDDISVVCKMKDNKLSAELFAEVVIAEFDKNIPSVQESLGAINEKISIASSAITELARKLKA